MSISQLLRIVALALALLSATAAPFKRYTAYQQYLAAWQAMVPNELTFNVSGLAQEGETCGGSKCQFFYFESVDPTAVKDRTVLLVSGMHGDEVIGPHTLLYAYPRLRASRIVYFPMANPSGFDINRRKTFPGKVDVNRDFPIDGNTLCYRTTAARVLDLLFRKYRFDLTLNLHNGGNGAQIAFNWGTAFHNKNSHTAEYGILSDIAAMLQREGGHSSPLGLMKFDVGTMDEVVYPASGTFDDWAYAAGKFPEITTSCRGVEIKPYPKDMVNGIFFLLELGPKGVKQFGSEQGVALPPTSNNSNNGFVARAVRMLSALMRVIEPRIRFTPLPKSNLVNISVQGCKKAVLSSLIVTKLIKDLESTIFNSSTPIQVDGDLRAVLANQTQLALNQTVELEDFMNYKVNFTCDADWVGQGTTVFANPRAYSLSFGQRVQSPTLAPASDQEETLTDKVQSVLSELALELADYFLPIAIVAACLLLVAVFGVVRRCCRRKKAEKFDDVVQVEVAGTESQVAEEGGDLHTARGGIIEM